MLFDTSAIIELLNETEKGKQVVELMKEETPAIAIVSLSELTSWTLRNGFEPKKIASKIIEATTVLPLDEHIAKFAGEIHFKNKKEIKDWGMIDSLIYATALANGLKLVTSDSDFKNQPETIFLE